MFRMNSDQLITIFLFNLLNLISGSWQNHMAGASGPPANTYNSVESGYNSYPTQNTMYSSHQPNTGHIGHSTGGNYNGAAYGSQYNSNYGY